MLYELACGKVLTCSCAVQGLTVGFCVREASFELGDDCFEILPFLVKLTEVPSCSAGTIKYWSKM